MTAFRPLRERRGPDPYLHLKMLLFAVGAAVGIAGMALERRWLIAVAIAVLAVGVLVRFLPRRDGASENHPDDGSHERPPDGPEDRPGNQPGD